MVNRKQHRFKMCTDNFLQFLLLQVWDLETLEPVEQEKSLLLFKGFLHSDDVQEYLQPIEDTYLNTGYRTSPVVSYVGTSEES